MATVWPKPTSTRDLTSVQIEHLLSQFLKPFIDHVSFLGVFPFDYFPHSAFTQGMLHQSICCVLNTDPSYKPGQHWVAFFREKGRRHIEFFDSYGFLPEKYHFPHFHDFTLLANKSTLQSFCTNECGHYCILFLYLRAYSIKTLQINSRFDHVINFLSKLSAGPALNRDINVKRIIDQNTIVPPQPLLTQIMIHHVAPSSSHCQRSLPFHALPDSPFTVTL